MNMRLPLLQPSEGSRLARAQPPLLGERAVRLGDPLFRRLERLLERFIRADLDPLAQAGAIANTSLIVACVTGVVLLFWYKTSVHGAYASVAAIDSSPLPHFVRSLHRYSSDAALLFALIHAAREVSAGRVGRVRWLAWTTGLVVVFALWLVGFLGYWLVWDGRAHLVALTSASMLDRLPILSDPLSRSFLADELLSSLLFFVVFFLHMLIPLALGIGLWLHITRLSRPSFLTGRALTSAVLASLSVLSLVAPADLVAPARMGVAPSGFTLDGWFLWPLLLVGRLGGGVIPAVALLLAALVFSAPWLLTRRRPRPAVVHPGRCTACGRCAADCPYDAIRMAPRDDGRPYPTVAAVDPDRCLGCGICAGSCDSAGIGLDWLDSITERQALDRLLEARLASGAPVNLAFVCAEAGGQPGRSPAEQRALLPDYEIVNVPCAGWVHPLLAERAHRRGAERVVIVGCAPGTCAYREGRAWTEARFAGEREPALRRERVGNAVRVLSPALRSNKRSRRLGTAVTALAAAVTLSAATWAGTRLGYTSAESAPELVFSLKLAGAAKNACRPLTADEKKKLPIHMQGQTVCERGRADVQVRISLDGREVLHRSYAPRGVWGDGNSVAIERLPVSAGEHAVRVEIGDGNDGAFRYRAERNAHFEPRRHVAVLFDQARTFHWY